jgi:hypothetical protein
MSSLLRSCLLVALFGLPGLAWAGHPHMVSCTQTVDGLTLTVDGKEAGLGDETQVNIVLTAEAACINPGNKHPRAANKESLTETGSFSVQNGQALFQLSVTAAFQPECSPPMSVIFTDISACDIAHDACCSF